MKKKLKTISLVLLIFTLLHCANATDKKTIKLGHGLDVNHAVHLAMIKMRDELALLSNNTIDIEIYPNQQLGSERECLELLQIGSLDMTKVSVGVLESFAPKMKVFGLPFLFQNREHAFEVLDGKIGQDLLNQATNYWLKGLGYYDAGSRSFYTKSKPINNPADLKGLKIRVMESPTAIEMIKQFEGSPTPISWGELYTSLQQGVVDGAENNPPSFYLSRHYEVCKYYSINEHTMLPDVLVMSTHTWNKFSRQEQAWIQTAAQKSVEHQRKLWLQSEQEALEEIKKAGVQVIYPEKEVFRQKVNGMYSNMKKNPELKLLIDNIQKANPTKK